MVNFCDAILADDKLNKKYQKHVERIASWYKKCHDNYALRLTAEAKLSSQMLSLLQEGEGLDDLLEFGELDYSLGAKLSYFVVSDALIKLILSRWSYGPDQAFLDAHGIMDCKVYKVEVDDRKVDPSWMQYSANSVTMTELLAKVLADAQKEDPSFSWNFDLMALQVDRNDRNDIAHEAIYAKCLSAIRCYNTIRAMLIFLDSQYANLPEFRYENDFDFDQFLSAPCDFDFDSYTTVLVASSVHDIPEQQRSVVANLPWDMIIDLDGYSEQGGLLAAKKHDRAGIRVLNQAAAKEAQSLVRGRTTWYRCGDYQDYSFNASEKTLTIAGHTAFKDPATRKPPINEVLKSLLKRAKEMDRPLNIVVLEDRQFFAQNMINLLFNDQDEPTFFVTWIGLGGIGRSNICSNWFGLYSHDMDEMDRVFRFFNTPVHLFYEAMFANADRWQPRESRQTDYTLPGRNGPVIIPENLRNNLEPYFDVLYAGCEKASPEVEQQEEDAFFRGHTASWNVIARGRAVPLKKDKDIRGHLEKIETTLSSTQTNSGKRFVFIRHTSGIGGTTFARQLAWQLHLRNYPVLSVKCFDPVRVPPMLENLYDNILDTKPIVILAEDTLRDRDKLFDYIKRINRRCVLLCAVRDNAAKESTRIPDAETIHLTNLEAEQINALQERFRNASPLSYNELSTKQACFEQELTAAMRTPFIIGLYYMEKDFNISTYIGKVFDGPSQQELEVLACMAMCDRLGYKNMPASYIQNALNLKPCESFIKRVPAAKSVVCSGISENIDVWHFTHQLLSDEFLDRYCGENYRSTLIRLAGTMIRTIAKVQNLNKYLLESLTYLLIQNRAAEEGFSQLMMEIGTPDEQRAILQLLIDSFKTQADEAEQRLRERDYEGLSNSVTTDMSLMNMIAHAYAHLGRMYSRRNVKLFNKATEMGENALRYLFDHDHRIYHMIGSIVLDKLVCEWDESGLSTNPEVLNGYENEMHEALKCFDDAIKYGSPEYGYPSKLELYYKYLAYLHKAFEINNEAELSKLPENRRAVLGEFMRTLEEAQNLTLYGEFSSEAVQKIERYENLFHSKILFGDYGKAVEFYENQVARYKEAHDVDRKDIALRNLLFTRIKKVRSGLDDPRTFPYGANTKECQRLFQDVTELLTDTVSMPENYSSYVSISTLYRYWFQLAKVTNVSVEEGIRMARRWVDMESSFYAENPRPYYQLMTALLLSVAENPLAKDLFREAVDLRNKISRMDSMKGKKWKIQDMFVGGTGMGRLVDVSHCPNQTEVLNFLKVAVKKMGVARPTPVEARILSAQTHAVISVYSPKCWNELEASLVIGKGSGNSFGPDQINRKVRTLLGFGFDGVEALSATAKDLENEVFDLDKLLAYSPAPAPAPAAPAPAPVRVNTKPSVRREAIEPGRKTSDIVYDENGKPFKLLCRYNEKTVHLHISDLMRFGEETLALYGGVVGVLSRIQALHTIPCVTEFKEIDGRHILTGSLYEMQQPLHELLGLDEPPSLPKTPVAAETSAEKATINVPRGTLVHVRLSEATGNRVSGTFRYEGTDYQALFTGISTSKQLKPFEDALRKGQSLPATIRSGPDKNDNYIVNPKR